MIFACARVLCRQTCADANSLFIVWCITNKSKFDSKYVVPLTGIWQRVFVIWQRVFVVNSVRDQMYFTGMRGKTQPIDRIVQVGGYAIMCMFLAQVYICLFSFSHIGPS